MPTHPLAHSPTRFPRRAGFSLLEVVLAMGIFFAAAAVLSQLLLIAARTARWGEAMTEATLRCESKMAELVGGETFLERRDEVPFLDDPGWHYSVEVMPTPIPSLVRVTVTVAHQTGEKQDVQVGLARLIALERTFGSFATGDDAWISPAPGLDGQQEDPSSGGPLTVEQMLGLSEEAP